MERNEELGQNHKKILKEAASALLASLVLAWCLHDSSG